MSLATNKQHAEYKRRWYIKNRERLLLQAQARRQENPELFRARIAEYRLKNLQHLQEKARQYNQRNREKVNREHREWYQRNRDKASASRNKWRKKNPHKSVEYKAKRRILAEAATINLAAIKHWIESVKSKPRFTCYYCEKKFPTSEVHFDHIIALIKGGSHAVENLCTACAPCNHSKHSKTIRAWVRVGQQVLEL